MEEEKKKTIFLFIFSTYILMILLKFWLGELVGCRTKFCIQRVPTRHTFDRPRYPKNKKYLKKCDDDFSLYFRHISLIFYSNFNQESLLDVELNFSSNEYRLDILFMGPVTPKIGNTWKNVMMTSSSRFFKYFLFLGSRIRQKYAVWVLVKSMQCGYLLDAE